MQSPLFRFLSHRKLLRKLRRHLQQPSAEKEEEPHDSEEEPNTMPPPIRELLTDPASPAPRYVRLHNANYTSKDLLSEILSMANRIVRRVSDAQMSSTDRKWWPVREVASKWDSIRAYPEMLQDVDVELLKILVLDAYADAERLAG